MPRLLILKCSARKRGSRTERIPALERYDGPLWQVLRAHLRKNPRMVDGLQIYALSAAFGLIPADQPIEWYDQTMSPARADKLRPAVIRRFKNLMQEHHETVCLGLSQRYLKAMTGWEATVPEGTVVTITDGTMGVKLGQLAAWLEGRKWAPQHNGRRRIVAPASVRGHAKISGVEITLSRDEVLACAREALTSQPASARRFRDWYVAIDDERVSPKWLVSVISGVSTSEFDAGRARDVLSQLGIDIEAVH